MTHTISDPSVPDWSSMQLPDTCADRFHLWNPWSVIRLLLKIIGRRRRVQVPDNVPGVNNLPKYIFQEFHNLPNGNYSKRLTHGYITGFDHMMLGCMQDTRRQLAQHLRDCHSVLDVGTASGRTAAAIKMQGVPDVWGMDPSPYLLQHAARRFSDIHFIQGVAERTPFSNARFDGIAVCFVMHEVPPKYIEQAVHEFARILKPGGKLVVCEPAASQLFENFWRLFKRYGWRGAYFKFLAHSVHEPFVRAWHAMNFHQTLTNAHFSVLHDEEQFPVRCIVARKNSPSCIS